MKTDILVAQDSSPVPEGPDPSVDLSLDEMLSAGGDVLAEQDASDEGSADGFQPESGTGGDRRNAEGPRGDFTLQWMTSDSDQASPPDPASRKVRRSPEERPVLPEDLEINTESILAEITVLPSGLVLDARVLEPPTLPASVEEEIREYLQEFLFYSLGEGPGAEETMKGRVYFRIQDKGSGNPGGG